MTDGERSRRIGGRRTGRAAGAAAALALAGCASPPDAVGPAYVSPFPYRALTCPQIAEELGYLHDLEVRLTVAQRQKHQGDALMIAGGVLVLPLFLVGGDDEQTYDLARVKGERQALRTVALSKGC